MLPCYRKQYANLIPSLSHSFFRSPESHSRIEDWVAHLPKSGVQSMCSWERFCTFAREPEKRRVGIDARITIEVLAKKLSLPQSSVEVAKLPEISENVIPFPVQSFVDPDPFGELFFANTIAAKHAIADYLVKPLAKVISAKEDTQCLKMKEIG